MNRVDYMKKMEKRMEWLRKVWVLGTVGYSLGLPYRMFSRLSQKDLSANRWQIDMESRARNCMCVAGAHTVGDMLLFPEEKLLALKSMGATTAERFKQALAEYVAVKSGIYPDGVVFKRRATSGEEVRALRESAQLRAKCVELRQVANEMLWLARELETKAKALRPTKRL